MSIKLGDHFEIKYPFYNCFRDEPSAVDPHYIPGCYKSVGVYENYLGHDVEEVLFIADGEGKICIDVVHIASIQGRYVDRVFYKKSYLGIDGSLYSRPTLEVVTITKLNKWIKNQRVFPCDYEVDCDAIEKLEGKGDE